jgi:TonB family protein
MELLSSMLAGPIFYSLSMTLLHFVWQGSLVAFGLYLVLRNVDNKYSNFRYSASLTAMLLNVALPVLTFFLVYQPDIPLSAVAPAAGNVVDASILATTEIAAWRFEWREILPLLSLAWMVGVFYLSGQLVYEMFKAYQLPRNGVVPTTDKIQRIFDKLASDLEVNRFTKLLISMKAEVPMVIGWIRPVVLLPLSMSCGLTAAQLEMLLAHELAHVKRHDYLVNFLQTLVEVILFFHPCVKWISRQVRAEREYCCDDVAVNHCGNAVAYAAALTDAEMLRPHNIPQLAMAASGGDLKNRVFRVVGHHSCAPKRAGQWMAGVFSFAFVASVLTAGQVVGMTHTYNVTEHNKDENSLVVLVEQVASVELKEDKTQTETIPEAIEIQNSPSKKSLSAVVSIEQHAEPVAKIVKDLSVQQKAVLLEKSQLKDPLKIVQKEKPVVAETATVASIRKNTSDKPVTTATSIVSNGGLLTKIAATSIYAGNTDKEKTTASQLNKQLAVVPSESKQDIEAETKLITKITKPKTVRVSPKVSKTMIPNFPTNLPSKFDGGDIYVSFNVMKDGNVDDITFDSKVHSAFKRSIRKALRRWKFEPGTIDGKKTEMRISKIFSFTGDAPNSRPITGSRLVKL